MDYNDLKDFLGTTGDDEDTFVESCWDNARLLLETATARAFRPVPDGLLDRMTLEVGAELYNRKSAPSGGSNYQTYEGGTFPVRAPRDPLTQVRPLLAIYVTGF